MTTKPFPIKLTEAERERLEAHRIALGLRSHADVVRHWIAQETSQHISIAEHAGRALARITAPKRAKP